MQKNDRFFTFLFSYSKNNITKIRRVQVSRRLLQTGSLSIFLFTVLGFFAVGLQGIIKNTTFAQGFENTSAGFETASRIQTKIDYSRPAASAAFAVNAGGPAADDDAAIDEPDVEARLKSIQQAFDPSTIPSIWAHLGKINNEFGFRRNPFGGRTYEFHAGMDIAGDRGDIVVAPAGGTVTKAGWQGGYGQMIEVDHGNGLITRYGHLSKLNVEVGDVISRGQLIGFVGSTGRSTGPHLHYELRLNDHPINPRRFLPPEPAEIARRG